MFATPKITLFLSFLNVICSGRALEASQPHYGASNPVTFSQSKFDFLVVGGGTSGLVIAARLTENPSIRVGIIEAGEYLPDDSNINLPQGSGYLGHPTYDWRFKSTPQHAVQGRSINYARGKMVGGSSGINTMIWQRASKEDYDLWGTTFNNGPGWTFDALLPYFKKSESWTPPSNVLRDQGVPSSLEAIHGLGGPIHASYNSFLTDVEAPSVLAANRLGLLTNSDPDAGNATGFSFTARSVDLAKGTRSYAANAYYGPNAHRPNLVLLTGAQVTKIKFAKSKGKITATGVVYKVGNVTYTAAAQKEVILAAGSLKTPQLLELSGVGNQELLSKLGIEVILNLSGVGENLQDHPAALSDFETFPDVVTLDQLRINSSFSREQNTLYNQSHTGALTYTEAILGPTPLGRFIPVTEMTTLLNQLDSTLAKLDQSPLQRVQYRAHRKLLAEGQTAWIEYVMLPSGGFASSPAANTSYVTIATINLHPFGRGSVHINSIDPLAPPVIDPKFLEIPFDAGVLVQSTKFSRKWMRTEPMSKLISGPNSPPASVQTDAQFDSYMRSILQTTNHPLGTTAMVPLELGGVVDPRLRVYGLENIRIVDAGIIPLTIGVAIMPTVYAIAEKAADMIKEDLRI